MRWLWVAFWLSLREYFKRRGGRDWNHYGVWAKRAEFCLRRISKPADWLLDDEAKHIAHQVVTNGPMTNRYYMMNGRPCS